MDKSPTPGSPSPEQEIAHLAEQCATLLRENERLRAALQSMLTDPPATLDEPDTDAEVVVIKMRATARRALENTVEAPEMCWHTENKP